MKRTTVIISSIALMLGLMTGCGDKTNRASQMQNGAKSVMEDVGDMAADVKNGVGETVGKVTGSIVDDSKFIGIEKAKDAALQKAGIPADGVTFEKAELDNDDGVWHYEVEFRKDNTEYEADVKAEDGTILKWDVDVE